MSQTMKKQNVFLEMLKRFNAKERNFLMRYALSDSPNLARRFVNDLVTRLQEIGLAGLDRARAVYFGMDYHIEWIQASLLLANEDLVLANGKSRELRGRSARIEDVDLLVVLKKEDDTLVLVLIEAKGVTPFDKAQFASKVARLKALRTAIAAREKDGDGRAWVTPIMLLTSPHISRPSEEHSREFAQNLKATEIGFFPPNADPLLLWMELKDFFCDVGEPENSLRIGTCYEDGTRAKTLKERTDKRYEYWRVEPRVFARKHGQ